MNRIFCAGLVGGIVMFIWSYLAYTVLPFGQIGIRTLPNEIATLDGLQQKIGEKSGLYLFPGIWQESDKKSKALDDSDEIAARYPSGLILYNAAGAHPTGFGRQLSVDFIVEVAEVLIAVLLLSQTRLTSFAERVKFILTIGIVVAISTNLSYWNWFGFPLDYTLVSVFVQVVGFLFAALAAALVMRKTTFGVVSHGRFLQKLFWSGRSFVTASVVPPNRLSNVSRVTEFDC